MFGGLEVAVDDAALVGRLQPLGDLQGDVHRVVEGERSPRDELVEALALDQLHDQEVDRYAVSPSAGRSTAAPRGGPVQAGGRCSRPNRIAMFGWLRLASTFASR